MDETPSKVKKVVTFDEDVIDEAEDLLQEIETERLSTPIKPVNVTKPLIVETKS
jgi:hypothetical protein